MGLKVKVCGVIKILFLRPAGKTGLGQNTHTSPKEFPESSLSMSAWKLWEILEFVTQEPPPGSQQMYPNISKQEVPL